MTKDKAVKILNIPLSAKQEEIEATYYKLVKRYPPEFNPDKFREIDEAYRYLTSFVVMIKSLLSEEVSEERLDVELFSFKPSISKLSLDDTIKEIKGRFKIAHLWSGLTQK
ncbi:MAG: DnaJ domain-containing protein [Candidatus Magnetoovum sp. WYHC-5]|nr:DnaJ domain-containing protein [Candidatus Magnetoovum sp. WYHC-5]